ncbi:RecX family transcriptional regulator [Sphingomonas sediminicola]|jgi:regulatory protein|uniref:Regulatory protein RecX n=1 Tax=Sphingomonas sediminicola TaxID=386874 RepID=A0ABX6TBW3_9SPHN|nr:RecX family transcriptional regulator [Sphingomonas sediminicola]QNP46223.1 RecX family transcriptional regulator [Sphingomonas sediminicola]
MYARKSARPRKPLNGERLHELALFYLGKFATTRAKLSTYLNRKVRERGWEGEGPPEIERLVERLAASGLIDDAAYALSKSRSLSERGYGASRVRQSLRMAGVEEEDGAAARELAAEEAAAAALRFARRRRIGPFADGIPERKERERALAAMIRAGHSFELARKVVDAEPGSEIDLEELREKGS